MSCCQSALSSSFVFLSGFFVEGLPDGWTVSTGAFGVSAAALGFFSSAVGETFFVAAAAGGAALLSALPASFSSLPHPATRKHVIKRVSKVARLVFNVQDLILEQLFVEIKGGISAGSDRGMEKQKFGCLHCWLQMTNLTAMHGDTGGVFGRLEAVVARFPGTGLHGVGLAAGEGGIHFGFGLGDGAAYRMFVGAGHNRGGEC